MPPAVARLVFTVGIAGLMWLDRDRKSRTSPAIWIAVAWLFLGSSRGVTQWLYGQTPSDLDQYVDGSPIDRVVLSGLQIVGLLVLAARSRKVGALLRQNLPLLVFITYCGVSMFWSDFPFVAFKRWTKMIGNITMVLIILTDADPVAAVKRAFARTGFLLIPLSMLLIKYYPDLGRQYSRWTWKPSFIGVSTDKNGLGVLTLVFGLAALWNLIEALRTTTGAERRDRAIAHASVVGIALWLFHMADSSTSLGCFLLGAALIAALSLARIERPATVHTMVGSAVVVGVIGVLVFDVSTFVIEALGRDATLTGRTELWQELLRMRINPWIGVGFESFWLGDRGQYFFDKYWWHPNEAHNGFLEMYLDLGWIGVGMLVMLMVNGYRNIVGSYGEQPGFGRIRLAMLLVAPIYGITEAAFKLLNPVWVAFLLATTAIPAIKAVAAEEGAAAAAPSPTRLAPAFKSAALPPFRLKPLPARRNPAFRSGK